PLSFLEASTPGTGGWIETPNQRLGIRHILPISKPQELARVTLEGAPSKRLGDIVTVVEDHQPLIGDAIINDAPALMLVVEKFPWANTADVTREVEHALRALSPGLSGLEMDPTLFRPATFLELAVDHLSLALLIAAILMVIALFAFFLNWRVALISTVAVLLSVIVAMTVLYLRGVTINMMILAGLAMALTAILDDAVIDIERIVQYLREARKQGSQKTIATLIYEASLEMRTPIIYATLVMVLAVMPVIFLTGVSGAFLQPLAFSYMLALIASLAVAMTFTPALSLVLLRRNSLRSRTPRGMQWLRRSYDVLFSRILNRPRPVLIATAAMVVISLALLPLLRQETLLPTFKETDLLVRLEGSTGASHPAMSRIATLASRELRAIPGVRNVSAHLGRAVMSDKVTDVHRSEIWVSLDPSADYDATVAAVKRVVAGYPGLDSEVLTYLQAKVREELSGTGESLIVRVYGEDMQIIREKAEEVHHMLDKIEGIEASKVQYPRERPTLEIEVDLDRAKRYGLKPGDIRRAATTMMSGILVGSLFEEQKVFDVVVWGTPETRHSLSSLQNLLIDTPSGEHVRLKEVADVRIAPAATVIHRDAVARRMDVTATVQGRDLVEVAEDVQQGLAQIEFPLEYRAELLGEYAERLAAEERVREYAIAALIGIFLLLQAAFRNWRLAAAIFFALPVTLLGGILVMFLMDGGLLSLGSMLGLVAVLGLAVRNTLVLVHEYRQREQMLHQAPGVELVRMATRDRSAAILLTAITTAAVLLPLVLLGNIAGLEILHPMAVVILGGLVTASLFTLIGVPAAYLLFGAAREPELELEEMPVRVVTEEDVREFLSRSRDLEKQVQSTQ
ncbi:MAG: efflux RND transporter permease subunit, partial [Calditrichaeota bacterium]